EGSHGSGGVSVAATTGRDRAGKSLVSRGVLPTITMATSDCRARATALRMSEPLLYVTVAVAPIFVRAFFSPCVGVTVNCGGEMTFVSSCGFPFRGGSEAMPANH